MEGGVLPRVARAPQTALGRHEAAQAVKALETCAGKGDAPSWSDVLDRFVEDNREVRTGCAHARPQHATSGVQQMVG